MISGIHVAPSAIALPRDHGLSSSLLTRDRLLAARVVSFIGPDQVQLEINGEAVTARTRLPLTPGEMLQVKVSENKSELLLQLQAAPKAARGPGGLFLPLLHRTGAAGLKTIAQSTDTDVKTVLEQLALKSGNRDSEFLPRLIRWGGMMLEAGLRRGGDAPGAGPLTPDMLSDLAGKDLKAALLNAGAAAGEGGRPAETLEAFQLLNTQSQESGRFLMPFPVLEDAGFRFGQLLIDTGAEAGPDTPAEERVIRACFLLDMTRLGPVRADFSFLNKAVKGVFLLEDAESIPHIQALLPELKRRLNILGYQVHELVCRQAEPSQTRDNALLDTLFKGDSDQVLNIVI